MWQVDDSAIWKSLHTWTNSFCCSDDYAHVTTMWQVDDSATVSYRSKTLCRLRGDDSYRSKTLCRLRATTHCLQAIAHGLQPGSRHSLDWLQAIALRWFSVSPL